MKRFFLFLSLIVALNVTHAQERHPFINVTCEHFTTDVHNNLYIWSDNTLMKYDSKGNLLSSYSNPALGDIATVDANYPSKVMVFHQNAGIIRLLDDKLAPIGNNIALFEKNLNTISLATMIGTNRIALYDNANQDLLIIDLFANIINTTHCSFDSDFQPCSLQSYHEESIMLLDSLQGIYVFDILGTFKNKINIANIKSFCNIGSTIIFLQNGRILSYDTKHLDFQETGVDNPQLQDFRISPNYFYFLEKTGEIYRQDYKSR